MRYAAYGSNLHPLRLGRRIASAEFVGTAFVPQWSLRFHKRSVDGSGKCSIVAGGSGIHVAVFEISAADKLVLDDIEGLGSGYRQVLLPAGSMGECVSYQAQDNYVDDSVIPYDWYRDLVLLGARAHGFPDSYIRQLAAMAVQPDPDPQRNAANRAIVDAIETTLPMQTWSRVSSQR